MILENLEGRYPIYLYVDGPSIKLSPIRHEIHMHFPLMKGRCVMCHCSLCPLYDYEEELSCNDSKIYTILFPTLTETHPEAFI